MSRRIVIVGGVAAGASAAARARRMNEEAEITLIEAGPYISFANCGLPYYVGGEIPNRERLFVARAPRFARRFNVEVRVNTAVTAIDRDLRTVTFATSGGAVEEMGYERLVLATGTVGVVPPIAGLDRDNMFTVRTVPDVDAITAHLGKIGPAGPGDSPPRALVIGGGYIGLETAEQLLRKGLNVTVVEMADRLMLSLDPEMAEPLRAALIEAGCQVILGDGVAEIVERDGRLFAATRSGREVPFDLGILAMGVRPNVELAGAAGITLGKTGAIQVDEFQRTSDPAVYAAGDNCEAMHRVLGHPVSIPWPARPARPGALPAATPQWTSRGRLTMIPDGSASGACWARPLFVSAEPSPPSSASPNHRPCGSALRPRWSTSSGQATPAITRGPGRCC